MALALVISSIGVADATADHSQKLLQELSAVSYQSEVSSTFHDSSQNDTLLDGASPAFAAGGRLDSPMVTAKGRIANVNFTFYDCKKQGFCGNMYNGLKVHQGAAACSWNLSLGTKFTIPGDPTKRVYVCEDRGLLTNTWVDIFWNSPIDGWKWQAAVGRRGTIDIVDIPR